MANYFDNQSKYEWRVDNGEVFLVTDHGSHTHALDLSNTTIGDIAEHTGRTLGEAHRAANHDFKKEDNTMSNRQDFLDSIKVSEQTKAATVEIGRNANRNNTNTAVNTNDGGRERGEPDREPAYKAAENEKVEAMRESMSTANEQNEENEIVSQMQSSLTEGREDGESFSHSEGYSEGQSNSEGHSEGHSNSSGHGH